MPKRLRIENRIDYGDLRESNREFAHLSFVNCGLSRRTERRSYFENCTFRDIHSHQGSVGQPIFRRCHFEDVVEDDLLRFYAAAFVECTVAGKIKNMNFGLLDPESVGVLDPGAGQRIMAENRALWAKGKFALDFSQAHLDDVRFVGEEIVPYVRFRRGQAVIWSAENLKEKVAEVGRAIQEKSWSHFILSNSYTRKGDRIGIAVVPEELEPSLDLVVRELERGGINVAHPS